MIRKDKQKILPVFLFFFFFFLRNSNIVIGGSKPVKEKQSVLWLGFPLSHYWNVGRTSLLSTGAFVTKRHSGGKEKREKREGEKEGGGGGRKEGGKWQNDTSEERRKLKQLTEIYWITTILGLLSSNWQPRFPSA